MSAECSAGDIPPGYKQTEVGVIPEDWEVSLLRNCCSKITDGTHDTPKPVRSGIPFVTAIHVKDNWIDYDSCLYVTEADHKIIFSRCNPEKNDVLMVNIGMGVATTALVNVDYEFSLKNVALLKPALRRTIGAYLNYSLTQRKKQITQDLSSGGAQPFLSLTQIGEIIISLPPTLAEQESIAKALSDADALIESLEQLIAKKRQIKKGAMQDLLTGKRRLLGFSGEWETRRFDEIAQLRKERIDPRRTVTQELCIELEHIEQGTGCLVGCTTTEGGSSLKSIFQKEDVLFGKLRAYLRKYWLADCEGVCSTEIWVLIAKRSVLTPHFLFQLVQVDRFVETASLAYGTHMPRSDWNVIKNYDVHLPKLEEQTAIASILSDMDAEITALEEKLAKARQIKQGMMQELLTGRIRLI